MAQTYGLWNQIRIFLFGNDLNSIIGNKLPSNIQILNVLFYNIRKIKLNIRKNAYLVIKETIEFGEKSLCAEKNNIDE